MRRDLCSSTRETDIPSDICFPIPSTHIGRDMCFPTRKYISLATCFLPWKHIYVVICLSHFLLNSQSVLLPFCSKKDDAIFEIVILFLLQRCSLGKFHVIDRQNTRN